MTYEQKVLNEFYKKVRNTKWDDEEKITKPRGRQVKFNVRPESVEKPRADVNFKSKYDWLK
jgi:hypothetical protein